MAEMADPSEQSSRAAEIGGDAPCWAHLYDEPLATPDVTVVDEIEQQLTNDSQGLVICDGDGRIVAWSDRTEQLLGRGRGEMIGTSVEVLIPPTRREHFWNTYFGLLRSEAYPIDTEPMELAVAGPGDTPLAASAHLRVLRHDDDAVPTSVALVIHTS